MQAYFEPQQTFSISMPQPVFEISIAYEKKHVAPEVSRQSLVNWRLADLGASSANQCTQNQMLGFFAVFFFLTLLFGFFLKYAFELERVTSK